MQKIARDRVKQLSSYKSMNDIPPQQRCEAELGMKLAMAGREGWDANFKTVYALSNAIQNRVIYDWTGKKLSSHVENVRGHI